MSYDTEVLADAPLAYWEHSEASGTTVVDSSGNGRAGTYGSSATLGQASLLPGLSGTAVSASYTTASVNKLATIPHGAWMNTPAFAVEGWFRLDAAPNDDVVVSRDASGNNGPWRLFIAGGGYATLVAWTSVGSTHVAQSAAGAVVAGEVYHYAFEYADDGGGLLLFLNGELVASNLSVTGAPRVTSEPVVVGGFGSPSTWRGTQQKTAIYDHRLGATRVAAHHAEALGSESAILLQDNFDRANSTTSLGSPQVGGPYTVRSGTWGILDNKAYQPSGASGATVTFPAAVDVDLQFALGVGPAFSTQPSAVFRYADLNNHWVLHSRSSSNRGALYICSGGSYTKMTPDFDYSSNPGDILRVVAFGPKIRTYVNGVDRHIEVIDPLYGNGASMAGLRSMSSGAGQWDNLLVQEAVPWPDWGAAPEAFDGVEVDFEAAVLLTPSLYKGRDTATADESEIS